MNLFSFIFDADRRVIMFFDVKKRQELLQSNPRGYLFDSHRSIADANGYSDLGFKKLDKYEYNPFTKILVAIDSNAISGTRQVLDFVLKYDFTELAASGLYDLDLRGSQKINRLAYPLPLELHGSLNLCSLWSAKDSILPEIVHGELNLSSLETTQGLTLPSHVKGDFRLGLKVAKNFMLPESIKGSIIMPNLEAAKNVVFPSKVFGNVYLPSLREAKNVKLPSYIEGSLHIGSLKDRSGIIMPERVIGHSYLV